MEKNTNTRLRDVSETKDEEVPQLQWKRKIIAQQQAPFAPKKEKVDKAIPSGKEPIILAVVLRKMKVIATRANGHNF